jgi:hypothetical protein
LPRLQPSKCRATVIPVMPVISPGGWHRYMEWGKQILQLNGIRWYTVYIYIIIYIYIPKKILYWQYIYISLKNHWQVLKKSYSFTTKCGDPWNWGESPDQLGWKPRRAVRAPSRRSWQIELFSRRSSGRKQKPDFFTSKIMMCHDQVSWIAQKNPYQSINSWKFIAI